MKPTQAALKLLASLAGKPRGRFMLRHRGDGQCRGAVIGPADTVNLHTAQLLVRQGWVQVVSDRKIGTAYEYDRTTGKKTRDLWEEWMTVVEISDEGRRVFEEHCIHAFARVSSLGNHNLAHCGAIAKRRDKGKMTTVRSDVLCRACTDQLNTLADQAENPEE